MLTKTEKLRKNPSPIHLRPHRLPVSRPINAHELPLNNLTPWLARSAVVAVRRGGHQVHPFFYIVGSRPAEAIRKAKKPGSIYDFSPATDNVKK
jgi:hypothetical protein